MKKLRTGNRLAMFTYLALVSTKGTRPEWPAKHFNFQIMKKLFSSIILLVLTGCSAQTEVNDGVDANQETLYAGDFTNDSVYFEDPSAYTVTEETIDGLEAKIYVPNEASSGKPTVLLIANPKGVEPCTEDVCIMNQENFEMLGDNLNEEELALALQIFRTVDFK